MSARSLAAPLAAMILLASAGSLHADPLAPGYDRFGSSAAGAYQPLVPVSAFARPAGWFDASRLRVSTSVSVGTGWGGRTDALQVTSLSYQLASPLAVRLSVGNTFGGGSPGSAMFLEGLAVSYRPHASFQINVDYRDVRSPLQYSQPYGFGGYGR